MTRHIIFGIFSLFITTLTCLFTWDSFYYIKIMRESNMLSFYLTAIFLIILMILCNIVLLIFSLYQFKDT